MATIVVNGEQHEVRENLSILHALRALGIEVPTLCHDERLTPVGVCRLCVVGVKGSSQLAIACHTSVSEGMELETETEELRVERRGVLSLLAHRYPADAIQQSPDKKFHRYLRLYGLDARGLGSINPELIDDSHPYIHVDMNRCIDCYRCVRICEEVQGQFVWQVWNRGAETRIMPDSGTTLRESSCVSCGACVDTCPTGALEDKTLLLLGEPTEWTKTTCAYCGTGCETNVGTRDGKIVSVRPALEAPVSKGHLCVKGRYAYGYNSAPDRITEPMIRDGKDWTKVTWEEALTFTAKGLVTAARIEKLS